MFLRKLIGSSRRKTRTCVRWKHNFTKIKDLNESHVGTEIQVQITKIFLKKLRKTQIFSNQNQGWINNYRKQSKRLFIDLKDGSSNEHLQVLLDRDLCKQNFGFGDAITITGEIGTAPRGHIELRATKFEINGTCLGEDGFYPFVRKQHHSNDYIRQHLHLRAHTNQFQAIFRARHLATRAFHEYFDKNAFTLIHTPILTSNSCEGAGELFSVQPINDELLNSMQKETEHNSKDEIYFNRKVFLTLSGQMHLEAMCFRLGSVYNFGPVFRSENSKSSIHMSEFYMIEAEECFVDNIRDITARIEDTIKTVTNHLLNNHIKDIQEAIKVSSVDEKFDPDYENRFKWLEKSFPVITYTEAAQILQKQYDFDVKSGLSKKDEFTLVEYFQAPLFVIDWPRDLKPFYMRTCKHDAEFVEAVDFLMPTVGELAGGSVREDSYDKLKDIVPKDLEWYADLRKYGGCTTGGFGIGFDRYLQVLLGISNIKDTIPFPRWPHHCYM